MDGAVYEAAKTWFKERPATRASGLHTGAFDEGRAGVSGALHAGNPRRGWKLVKRLPVFWGQAKFLLVPAQDLARISSFPDGPTAPRAGDRQQQSHGRDRGYYGSHTTSAAGPQNRTAVFHEDIDGDGTKELATAINGTWNRVTVYSDKGVPLYNAQFGPGRSSAPRAQMRDMDVADLDGDGKKELVVGISEGLVVALDGKCQPIWSTRLPSPPVSLRSITPPGAKTPQVVVGCDDGAVAAFDEKGKLIRLGKVAGRPAHIVPLQTSTGPLAVVATDQGEVKAFRIGN